MPTFQPYWGKPAVRNDRGDRGDVGIIRSPVRASILPDSLDIGVCFPQLPELATFAKAVPDLTIILNHLGGLTRIGPYANRDDEVLPTWQGGLAAVAQCPNVNLKLGGIGMPRLGFDWHTRARPIGSEEVAASIAP